MTAGGLWATVPQNRFGVPHLRGPVVRRSRLLGRIAVPADGTVLTMVSASPGAGKTSLMAEAHRDADAAGHLVGWVGFDSGDDQPFFAWSAILAALNAAVDGKEARAAVALQAIAPPKGLAEPAFLADLCIALDMSSRPIRLFVDDFHELTSRPVLRGVELLLRRMPSQLQLVIGSRFDPALGLPRLRLQGKVNEIRTDDLAFTEAEASELLREHGVDLDENMLSVLVARTEGWAAGLRLAAMSLRRSDDHERFIKAFAGDDRSVSDYLVAEIVSAQPKDVQEFMLMSCVPDELTGDLARALTGRADAGQLLDRLEHANALVTRNDYGEVTYRYHTLLRDYLRAELSRQDAPARPRLDAAAARWYAVNGRPTDAVLHGARSEDPALFETLIREYGISLILDGESRHLRSLIAAQPGHVTTEPVFALVGALAALETGDVSEADHVMGMLGDSAGEDIRVLRYVVQLNRARITGDGPAELEKLMAAVDEVRRDLSADDAEIKAFVSVSRGMALIALGRYAQAKAELEDASEIAERNEWVHLHVQCLALLTAMAAAQCDFRLTLALAERAAAAADTYGISGCAHMAPAYIAAAWASWHRCHLESAQRFVTLADASIVGDIDADLRLGLAGIRALVEFHTGADRRGALSELRSLWTDLQGERITPALLVYLALMEQRMAFTIGEPAWTPEPFDRTALPAEMSADFLVLDANIQIHSGRTDAARRILRPVITDDLTPSVPNMAIAAWLLESSFADEAEQPTKAQDALVRAIEIAAPLGSAREFIEAPTSVYDRIVVNTGRFARHDGFVHEVITAFGTLSKDGGELGSGVLGALIDRHLTPRELEVLRDLPSMLTVEEIAAAHVVSVNTVKTHLRGLYRKLAVDNRRAAVQTARHAGLL